MNTDITGSEIKTANTNVKTSGSDHTQDVASWHISIQPCYQHTCYVLVMWLLGTPWASKLYFTLKSALQRKRSFQRIGRTHCYSQWYNWKWTCSANTGNRLFSAWDHQAQNRQFSESELPWRTLPIYRTVRAFKSQLRAYNVPFSTVLVMVMTS